MFEIYVDGSCSGNGEKENFGGIGVVLVKDNKVVKEYSIPVFNTTNNRAELKAVIFAIQIAKILNKTNPREILIYSDSAYVVQIVNQWMFNWASKGWKKADNKEPENLDLVKILY
ncbi:MAG: reverse transcriptase-like protein, partial [Clostridiales bacterium]|nr:reverse transcriptase-like protein [Clostridiales bacterium]